MTLYTYTYRTLYRLSLFEDYIISTSMLMLDP